MVYSDTTTKQGIIQIEEMALFGDNGYMAISSDADRLYQFTALNNQALDRFVFLAMTADGRWQWDDSNYTDMSIATTNIVSGQRDYEFALDHLEIEKVLAMDNNGKWNVVTPIDEQDLVAKPYIENNSPNTGVPISYDKRGTTIFFNVIPNYSATAGLKIYFKRGASYFAYTDTTKKPGIPSIFHKYVPIYSIAEYAVNKSMPAQFIQARQVMLQTEERAILAFYSRRNKDEKPRLIAFKEDNR